MSSLLSTPSPTPHTSSPSSALQSNKRWVNLAPPPQWRPSNLEGNPSAPKHVLLSQAFNTKHLLRTNHVHHAATDAKTGGLSNMVFVFKGLTLVS